MTVQGNLGTIGQGADNLLRMIQRDKMTGRLSLFYENEKKRNVQDVIFIDNGIVVGLKSLERYGVKELLVFGGKISREQVEDAVGKAKAAGGGKTAEHIMLEEGTITREMVIHAIATLVRGCIQRILTKPYGLFIFHPSDQLKGVKAITRISFLQIVLDYSRALSRQEVFSSLIPSMESVVEVAVDVEEIRKRYHLTEDEWKILFQANNERTLSDLVDETSIPEERLRKLTYTLLMGGFVILHPPKGPQITGSQSGMGGVAAPSSSAVAPPPSTSGGMAPPASSVPPAPSSGAAAPSPSAASAPTGTAPAVEEEQEAQGTILVIDDSKTIQKMVEIALKPLPYRLVMADDGFMGLEKAQECDPDLVILDVIMPKLDGYKTCSQLKKVFAPRKVPVIMLTARDGAFDKIKGRLAGASMYMAKPFETEELQKAVSKYLEGGGED